jgi:hypothetical protein
MAGQRPDSRQLFGSQIGEIDRSAQPCFQFGDELNEAE